MLHVWINVLSTKRESEWVQMNEWIKYPRLSCFIPLPVWAREHLQWTNNWLLENIYIHTYIYSETRISDINYKMYIMMKICCLWNRDLKKIKKIIYIMWILCRSNVHQGKLLTCNRTLMRKGFCVILTNGKIPVWQSSLMLKWSLKWMMKRFKFI